ncbi:MAG: YeeE/YedE thiosulfate transporter family protein [Kiritimatiellae bacterium]|nr:YeeE/YedE thiosulfate transporter family protein [Kiritimatiellia bacterium]
MKMNYLFRGKWSPYLAGALAGLLAVASVVVTTKVLSKPMYLGASTSFVRAAGLIEQKVAKKHVKNNKYFQSKKVKVDWQMMFVAGILAGALFSSLAGRSFKLELVPEIWRERFGKSPVKRAVGAFFGGVILLFGVRMAGGCPSGHGLSGMMQLSVSGVVAMVAFMVGGIVTAKIFYRRSW